MTDKNYNELMQKEIQARMESSTWDFSMASAVMERKRVTRRRYTFAASSLAFAALLMVVFMFGIDTGTDRAMYNDFIATQIEATHEVNFEKKVILTSSVKSNEALVFSDDMTSLIDDALIMR